MKILFVCRGNVGRSQMAEALCRKRVGGDVSVLSAGTKVDAEGQALGELLPDVANVLEAMSEVGEDISSSCRKQVTPGMADWADHVVLVVDDRDPVPDYLLGNPKVTRWNVLDPKGQSLDFTRQTRDQISELLGDFFGRVSGAGGLR